MPDRSVDVLVAGAGPAGLYAAERLASAGARVLVCEEHSRIGDPVHCTGILATDSFRALGLPETATLNPLKRARFVSPAGITVSYATDEPLAVVIDRPVFDRALADRAERAGVQLLTGARVSSLEITRDDAWAIAGDERVRARLVIIACGAHYALQRRFGLGITRAHLQTAQRELPAERPGDVELHFGREVAPDGFGWAVPVMRPEGSCVRVGVMSSRDAAGCYARLLARIRDRWGVAPGESAPPRQKILPLSTIDRTCGDRLLVVGDAAGLVKPTTGGGIHYALLSASLAADVALRGLASDRLDLTALAGYERAWRRELASELASQRTLRHIATRMDDREIDALFELASTDGILPIVRATARFNQHGPLIRALLRHPPARKILFRSIVG
jgi:geranylgeranyl reductase family protein